MATKAYLMINMEKRFSDDGYYLDALRELAAIPEVESVEPVSGICDLMVKVNAPVRAIFVADKIRPKEWVKSLRILRIEPTEASATSKLTEPELSKLVRT